MTTQSLKKAARGDLGAILIRAAEIDPEQRYLSAEAFGDDLRRYVEGRPITARPGTRASRAWKWTLRNPRAAVLGTILLATVSLSAIGVTVQTVRATRQRRVAQLRLEDLVQLTGVLDGELYQSLGGLGQADAAKRTLLDGARQTLNHLADERGERADSDLVLEMSQQYEQLAGLEVNSVGSSHQEQRAQGAADAIRALTLLKTLPARMQEEPAIAKQYQDLQSLQQAGRPQ